MIRASILLCLCATTLACSDIDFVSRKTWGALKGKGLTKIRTPVNKVFIHHTAGPGCGNKITCRLLLRFIQIRHLMRPNYVDIGYNFLVGGDGRVYIGRGWNKEGGHTKGYNKNGIAIAMLGNYVKKNPSSKMQSTAKKLIACGVSKGHISRKYGLYAHLDVNDTECPGKSFYKVLRKWKRWHALGKLKRVK